MRLLKIFALLAFCGLLRLCAGIPASGMAVGFAAAYGAAPALLAGAIFGALFSGLPMRFRAVSALMLALAGGLAGRLRPSGFSLYLSCAAITVVETLCEAVSLSFAAGGFTDGMAVRTGIYLAISLFITAIVQPILGRMSREKYA